MNEIGSVNMKLHFALIQMDVNPRIVRSYVTANGTTINNNTDASFSWNKNSKTMDDVRLVEEFVCKNNAVMNDNYIEDWTPSTSRGDYTNYTTEMLECLFGIYLSEFQKPMNTRITSSYQLDVSDPSNASIDVANSPNANAIKDLFVAAGFVFSVKSL